MALPEYMMAGKPIVASSVDAIPNIIRDGENGLLVEVDDASGASKAVYEFSINDELKDSLIENAYKDVHERFDEKRVASEHMKLVEEIFEKATVRGFVDYLLYGLPPESEERNYQARLDEPYLEYEKVALEYDSNGASELLSLVNAMTCENACVYMELGVQAGILLIADIVQNLRREEIENIHYRNKCELLIEDIRQVLEIMKDSMTDECKQNMTNILNKWGAERKGEE